MGLTHSTCVATAARQCLPRVEHGRLSAAVQKDVATDVANASNVAVGTVVSYPSTPFEDTKSEYVWCVTTWTSKELVDKQYKGFVVTSKHKDLPNAVYMRKPVNCHRFATVSHVNISNATVNLGASRVYENSITRDVVSIHPEQLKIHSLTLLIASNGLESYVCNGTSFSVTFPSI